MSSRTLARVGKRYCVPWWLAEGDGGKVIDSLVAPIDGVRERARYGLYMRWPTYAARYVPDALDDLGASRGLQRGKTETDEHFANRLLKWRSPRGHRVRGNAFALLEQISEYWGKAKCYTIDRRGNRCDLSYEGEDSFSQGNTWNWDSAPATPNWARFWIVVDGSDFTTPHAQWGPTMFDGLTSPTWGQRGVTSDDVASMRRLVQDSGVSWKPAGTMPEWLVLSIDGSEPGPDATWEHWSTIVEEVQEPARDPAMRYWSLRPALNNTYAGIASQFCNAARMPDGSASGGDKTSFPTSVTLPVSGVTYSGDSTKFPLAVQLIDDGDPVL